jgi:hypothetical protein
LLCTGRSALAAGLAVANRIFTRDAEDPFRAFQVIRIESIEARTQVPHQVK